MECQYKEGSLYLTMATVNKAMITTYISYFI